MRNDLPAWKRFVLQATSAHDAIKTNTIQSLWSGYGEIFRVQLKPLELGSLIVKHIAPDNAFAHPRGWDSDISTQRKLRSYEVEDHFYTHYASLCGPACRVPKCAGTLNSNNERLFLLEDLDAVGYPVRITTANLDHASSCLRWLAQFHATYMHNPGTGLWPVGTYWHLQTRPDELDKMPRGDLYDNAKRIDQILSATNFKTLVHGDAKLANFCFSKQNEQVAAVDFQYAGGGCGIKDVAYFISSAFNESQCEQYESKLLDCYFTELEKACTGKNIDFNALESEWRELYAMAWTDFFRFLMGWMPDHVKIHSYSKRLCQETLKRLDQ